MQTTDSHHVYYVERCTHCDSRACITTREDYPTLECANRICDQAEEGESHCLGPCCHGCQCVQDQECVPEECRCDCHCEHICLLTDPLPPADDDECEPVIVNGCTCSHCINYRPVYVEKMAEEEEEDVWVSNRPTHCVHFNEPGKTIISTYYDNSDGTNMCIDDYFSRIV
jgi:hypothetical protein